MDRIGPGNPGVSPIVAACLIIAIVVAAYLPAMDAGFVFDDRVYLTQDSRMESVEGLGRIWTEIGGSDYRHQYYPMTKSALWVQHQLWGDRPFGYHLVNVLLHAANAILLWRLLRRLSVQGAWVAGAIFAVHPVHVQSVAWVTELKNVLSTLFFLLSAGFFVAWLGIGGTKARRHEGTKEEPEAAGSAPVSLPFSVPSCLRAFVPYCRGLVLFIAALLSKTATCLLPVALALLVWWKRGRLDRRSLLAIAPLAVIGASFVAMTVLLETHHRAHGEAFEQTWPERILIAGRAVWFYAGKLAWPAELMMIYPRWEVDAAAWAQYAYPAAAIGVLMGAFALRRRIGNGPAAALLFFAVAVAPMSFVNVAFTRFSFVADHWQYWASMGLIALAAGVAFGAHLGMAGRLRPAAAAAVIAVLAGATWERALAFQGEESLWRDTLSKNPQAWAAWNNLALSLSERGRSEEAIDCYREAVRLNPRYSEGHNNLGAALMLRGDLEEAIEHYREALRLEPDLAGAHYNLALATRSQGRIDESIRHYQEALHWSPRSAEAHNGLGELLERNGLRGEAADHFRAAVGLDPGFARARLNLGRALRVEGKLDESIAHLRRAVEIDPDYRQAHNNLGNALVAAGRADLAITHFGHVLRLGDDAHARYNLGIAESARGRPREAIAQYRAALSMDPGHAEAQNTLGTILQAEGLLEEAAAHYREAIRLDPESESAHFNLGGALLAMGLADEAAACHERALELGVDAPLAHLRLGQALFAAGRHDDALEHLSEARRLRPRSAAVLAALARALAAHPDPATRDAAEAVRLASRAVNLGGADVEALGALAAAWAAAGRLDDALDAAGEAVDAALATGDDEVVRAASRRLELLREAALLSNVRVAGAE